MYPFIRITSSFMIPTYYLVISLMGVFSLFWITTRARKYQLSYKLCLDLSLIIMVMGFVGARLMHVFYESFDYYQEDFLRIFYFWDGGFVFYGGALLAALSALFFLHKTATKETEIYLDLFAPVLSFTYAAGRVGCLLAGCCYGKFCELPWAIAGRHPTQLYASLWELGVLCILLGLESIPRKYRQPAFLRYPGKVFYLWMILHSIGRLLMESFREDFRGPSLGLSISSWISWILIVSGLVLIFRRKPQL